MIEAWLATKAAKIALYALAILGLVLIPVTAYQAIQIHGWPIFGGGLKAEVASLDKQINDPDTGYLVRIHDIGRNSAALDAGLQKCNASIDGYKVAADDKQQRLDAALAGATRQNATIRTLQAQIAAFKPTGDSCADLNALYNEVLK
jgi:hypothetical protein